MSPKFNHYEDVGILRIKDAGIMSDLQFIDFITCNLTFIYFCKYIK